MAVSKSPSYTTNHIVKTRKREHRQKATTTQQKNNGPPIKALWLVLIR